MDTLGYKAYEKKEWWKGQILSKIIIVIFLSCGVMVGFYLIRLGWIENNNTSVTDERKEFPDNYHNAKDKIHIWACGGSKSGHSIRFSSEDNMQTVINFYLDELSKPRRTLLDVSKEQDKSTKSHFTKIIGHDQVHQWIIYISSENDKTWVSVNETFLEKNKDSAKPSHPLSLSLNNLETGTYKAR